MNYGSICRMRKDQALQLLGGGVAAAAQKIGITYQAVDKWPDELPTRIEDRVLAALARDHLDLNELLGAQATTAGGECSRA